MKSPVILRSVEVPVVSTHGSHIVADLYGCNSSPLNDEKYLTDLLIRAAKSAHATVPDVVAHSFTPQGVTILVLLAESHLSIHTWPEKQYAAVDVMTCGDTMKPQNAVDAIAEALSAKDIQATTIVRGERG